MIQDMISTYKFLGFCKRDLAGENIERAAPAHFRLVLQATMTLTKLTA